MNSVKLSDRLAAAFAFALELHRESVQPALQVYGPGLLQMGLITYLYHGSSAQSLAKTPVDR